MIHRSLLLVSAALASVAAQCAPDMQVSVRFTDDIYCVDTAPCSGVYLPSKTGCPTKGTVSINTKNTLQVDTCCSIIDTSNAVGCARPNMTSENNEDADYSERQPLYEGKQQSRQFTVAGVVSTKQRRLEDHVIEGVTSSSYSTNSNKELLCLEYVANFRKQFDDLMDASDICRPPLYLCPPNERGIPKFVCTTLRPTLLPFLDLYDMDKLATFVSGLIEYEPLVDPCAPPACLPSPSAVLAWQAGDSFDMANVLASFLIGAGYDAYVVHGTTTSSLTAAPSSVDTAAAPKDEGKSKFVAMQEAKDAARRADEAARLDWTKYMDVDDEDEDELDGKRVHAWVLVRAGRRDGKVVLDKASATTTTLRKLTITSQGFRRDDGRMIPLDEEASLWGVDLSAIAAPDAQLDWFAHKVTQLCNMYANMNGGMTTRLDKYLANVPH
ncbi:hypothetical protein DYB30_009986 [Aphanomyces astaci]|uniref:Uncharacterized protein n=1 Tax=Aphanomyces astaci TaxID=112090 RepID=A0A397CV38_APHAT|nr:hypothetical protein DYB30_009986 [Aphanomyces astaci]